MNEDEKIYLRYVVTDRTGKNIISETRYELTGIEPGNDDPENIPVYIIRDISHIIMD